LPHVGIDWDGFGVVQRKKGDTVGQFWTDAFQEAEFGVGFLIRDAPQAIDPVVAALYDLLGYLWDRRCPVPKAVGAKICLRNRRNCLDIWKSVNR